MDLTQKITQRDYLKLFEFFSPAEKAEIALKINSSLFDKIWKDADAELPDQENADELALKELQAVRYGKS